MNVGKNNEDIISVKTLLAVAPNLPSGRLSIYGDT